MHCDFISIVTISTKHVGTLLAGFIFCEQEYLTCCSVFLSVNFLLHYFQEAEHLISCKIHPQTIIAGYRKAADRARQALTDAARDNGSDEEKFGKVSRTSCSTILVEFLGE